MLGHREMKLEDYLGIARRHIWLLILAPIAVSVGAYLVSRILPASYSSTTQVLVQGQSVPTEIAQPIITGTLNEHLASMKEEILSRTHLQPLLEQFNLFNDSKLSMEVRIGKLRDAIQVESIRAMEDTRASQLPGFRITVTLGSARLAQQVCTEIYKLFSEEEGKSREAGAEGITDFLDQSLKNARAKMDEQEAKLAAFKSQYLGSLPDDDKANLAMIGSLSTQLDAVTRGLDADHTSKSFNESMLQQQETAWKAKQSSLTTTGGANPDSLQEELKKAQEELVELRSQYTDEYPDVKKKVLEIEQLKQKIAFALANKPATSTPDSQTEAASNATVAEPQEIQQLRATLGSLEISIQSKTKEQQTLRGKIQTYESRLLLTPVVEQKYTELTRDSKAATDDYNTLLKQQDTAVRSADLEKRQQGEQFKVLDPANLPEKPVFPNRLYFAGGGFGGGLALGIGLVLVLEMKDKSLRTESDVEMFLKIPTLAMVPVIDKRSGSSKRFIFPTGKDDASLHANT